MIPLTIFRRRLSKGTVVELVLVQDKLDSVSLKQLIRDGLQ
jgi:hypothetical protein